MLKEKYLLIKTFLLFYIFLLFNLGTVTSNAFNNSISIWSSFGSSSSNGAMMWAFGALVLLITALHLRKSVFFIQTLKQLHFRCLYVEKMVVLNLFCSSLHFKIFTSLLICCNGAGFCYIINVGIQWKVDFYKIIFYE